ncbi:MAG: inositol monophosphatase [Prevotella sp.]|nr:inositol monophosphatase [Prevotella sp.]
MNDLKTLTLSVCEVAKRAGKYIGEERKGFRMEAVERKHAHDYVSYVDKSSERLIVDALRKLLPEAGFITEEGSATHGDEQYCWVVDPLDGTTNFIHGFAPYCVSIALCCGSDILLGVVYEIVADECFFAWKGGGAFCNGKQLHVSNGEMEDALLCLQLPYNSNAYKPVILHLISQFYGRAASIRMIGSAAMALCYVAAGRLDAYAEKYIGQWDFMAGAIIVSEAGGRVTDYQGNSSFTQGNSSLSQGNSSLSQGNSVVASNGIIHQVLLDNIP